MDWDRVNWERVAFAGDDGRKKPDNRYPGCTCPSWRYCPWKKRPTNPDCPEHGEVVVTC